MTDDRPLTLHTAADLAAAIRDLRPDAEPVGIAITNGWARQQLEDLYPGVAYADVTWEILRALAERVDTLA